MLMWSAKRSSRIRTVGPKRPELEPEVEAERADRRIVAETEAGPGAEVSERHVVHGREHVAGVEEPDEPEVLPQCQAHLAVQDDLRRGRQSACRRGRTCRARRHGRVGIRGSSCRRRRSSARWPGGPAPWRQLGPVRAENRLAVGVVRAHLAREPGAQPQARAGGEDDARARRQLAVEECLQEGLGEPDLRIQAPKRQLSVQSDDRARASG